MAPSLLGERGTVGPYEDQSGIHMAWYMEPKTDNLLQF